MGDPDPPSSVKLTAEQWQLLQEVLANPPEPTQALIDLMAKAKRTPDWQSIAKDQAGALSNCRNQFQFYADEHTKAGKLAKAATNQSYANLCEVVLDRFRAAGGVL